MQLPPLQQSFAVPGHEPLGGQQTSEVAPQVWHVPLMHTRSVPEHAAPLPTHFP